MEPFFKGARLNGVRPNGSGLNAVTLPPDIWASPDVFGLGGQRRLLVNPCSDELAAAWCPCFSHVQQKSSPATQRAHVGV